MYRRTTSHEQEYMGSKQRVFGGRGTPMDEQMSESQQRADVQNFVEPKYVKQTNLLEV